MINFYIVSNYVDTVEILIFLVQYFLNHISVMEKTIIWQAMLHILDMNSNTSSKFL
jgi:hypothetical protein